MLWGTQSRQISGRVLRITQEEETSLEKAGNSAGVSAPQQTLEEVQSDLYSTSLSDKHKATQVLATGP